MYVDCDLLKSTIASAESQSDYVHIVSNVSEGGNRGGKGRHGERIL